MQVVIHRLDASYQKAEWGKRLMKLRVSTILNKKGQTGYNISVVVFRKIPRHLYNKLAR
jgi:hypothetical protein